METHDQDNLYNTQRLFQSFQKQNLDQEYKDLNLLQDVSCWSETQNSKISCIQSQTENIRTVNSAESRVQGLQNNKKEDEKIETSIKNQQTQDEQIIVQIQQISNRNIKSKTFSGAQDRQKESDKNKLSSLSYGQYKTIAMQKGMNSNFKNKNITDSISFMMKLKQKITYYQRVLTLSGRSKYITEAIRQYINDKSDSSHNKAQNWLFKYDITQNRICIDLIPIIIVYNQSSKMVQILIFIKAINVLSDIAQFQKYLCMVVRKYYFVILVNLVFKIFIFAHIISCMWYIIALIEINYMNIKSWIEDNVDMEEDWWKLYIQSLYWALTLMTTGSNIATTTLQLFFTAFIMIFTTIAFGYLLNIVGFVLETIDKQDEQKRSDINIINEYMRQKKISQNLQSKINISLEYYYSQNTSKLHQQSEEILDKLSLDLKVSLAKEFIKRILNKIEILNKNFSNSALDLLCFSSLEEFYLPNQIIFSESHNTEPSLIYVISGQVEVVYFDQMEQGVPVQYINSQIKEGQICGQIEFFTGISQQRYFRSTEYSQILRITNKDLIDIVKRDQKDFERFCQIRDNILMYEQYSSLQLTCSICNYSTHQVVNCPMIHLQKYFLLSKIGISQKQQQNRQSHDRRLKFKRKKKLTENNVMHGQFIQENLQKQQVHSNSDVEYVSSEETDEQTNELESKTNTQQTDAEEHFKIQRVSDDNQETEIKTDKRKSIHILQLNIPQQKMQSGNYRQSILQQVEEISSKGELIDLANLADLNLKNMAKRKQSVLNKKMEFTFEIQQYADTNHKVRASDCDFSSVLSPQKKQSAMFYQNNASQLNNSQDLEDRSQPIRKKDRNKTFTRNTNSHLTQVVRMQQFQNLNKQQDDELENPWTFEKLQDYKFYFSKGNSKNYLQRYNKFYNKKFKDFLKKSMKK
ncbi:cyclic nucleotide-binding domain protein (macronuclear) [Tetrahymena thermophila SB210]|uniref:Cyclic nucleotide-binding domain protein n=1 Tax=Tetrahymena thermophila (strain SB210) TaxID=312017 RepID=Q23G14_TETTS|nr:cyclic nucleotide-binding domain protein [Tetrahymena thermophila SB210]EAR95446.2 cyclic nucleotide-binding domain protein [Tetrahymena thermophila SB210]|eukprot:XP_001015691.2 cyclic nucleotide-binding domain protein [Tetrahymena thermophila SB210]